LRTPTIHFDFFLKEVSYGHRGYEAITTSCQDITDDQMLRGVISNDLARLDGTSRAMGYAMMLYDRLGQNTFVVGPRVQELFKRTTLSKVTYEMLVAPTRAFYVALVDCPWRIWGGDRTQWHQVQGVYVSFTLGRHRDGRQGDGINFCIWGAPNERSISNADDAVLWHSINLEEWKASEDDLEGFFEKSNVMSASADNPKGWVAEDPLNLGAALPGGDEELEEQREMLRAVMRTVLNVCLYTSSEDADVDVVDNVGNLAALRRQLGRAKAPGKRKKLERRIASAPRTRIVNIGPMFEVTSQSAQDLEKLAREHGGGTHASPIKHTVMPHYQRYWVGTGDGRRAVWKYRGMYTRGSGKPERTIMKIRET